MRSEGMNVVGVASYSLFSICVGYHQLLPNRGRLKFTFVSGNQSFTEPAARGRLALVVFCV